MMDTKRSETHDLSYEILQRMGSDSGKEVSGSVRKLAASLREIKDGKEEDLEERNDSEMGRKERGFKPSKLASSKASHLSDPFYSPISERLERCNVEISHRRRASFGSQKRLQSDYLIDEIDEKRSHGNSRSRHLLKDVCHSLTTSKQLVRVLSRVWSIEEQRSTCISLFATLKSELDRACVHATKLIREQRCSGGEIEALLEEEKISWRMKEQSLVGEVKSERKARKQCERVNKKLGREVCETKAALAVAVKEGERQKRAMERACEELAKGEARLEELKREVHEEVEKERQMLQLADIIREEGVQMKLSEAKYEFEQKTLALDKVKAELEAYLVSKKVGEESVDVSHSPNNENIKALKKHLRETLPEAVGSRVYPDQDSDSVDSDLHSIELNMDEWRNPSASLERQTSDAIEWEFRNGESGSETWRL